MIEVDVSVVSAGTEVANFTGLNSPDPRPPGPGTSTRTARERLYRARRGAR